MGLQLDSEKLGGAVCSTHRLFTAPGGSVLSMGDIEAKPLSSSAALPAATAVQAVVPVTSTRQVNLHFHQDSPHP